MRLTYYKIRSYLYPLVWRLVIITIVALFLYSLYTLTHLFMFGTDTVINLNKNYIDGTTVSAQTPLSHTCVVKQEQIANEIQPLQAQSQTLGTYLSTAAVPIKNGQALLNQYADLNNKIWHMETEAASCH